MRRKTLRLAVLGQSPCHLCRAACCKQNGHEYAVLLEGDETRRFRPFSITLAVLCRGATGVERVIPYRHGRCPFLGDDDLCSIYDDRPTSCRRFQCVTGYNHAGASAGRHSEFLRRNPDVTRMLDDL